MRPKLGLPLLAGPTLCLAGAFLLTACGTAVVKAYDGPELPKEELTSVFSNPHLDLTIDRSFTLPRDQAAKLHRLDLPKGHHVLEVKCLYTADVTYHPAQGAEGSTAKVDASYTESPVIALTIAGDEGHGYKPRVHFERDANGVPACKVKVVDVTAHEGGEKSDLY